MDATLHEDEKTGVMTFTGSLGLADLAAFESQLPDPKSVTRLVLDFSNVSSIDSSIIAAIMGFRGRFVIDRRDPFDIVVIASSQVNRVLELTGVTRAVTVLPATADTIEKMRDDREIR